MLKKVDIKKIEHCLFAMNIVVAIFTIIVVAITFFCGDYEKTRFNKSENVCNLEPIFYSDNQVSDEIVEFPFTYHYTSGEPIVLNGSLPDTIPENYGIMINTNYSKVSIYVGDELIGSYAQKTPLSFGRLVGNIRAVAPLKPEYAGMELVIKQDCYYTGNLTINYINYGSMDGLVLNILRANMWRIILSVALITLSILCFGLSLSQKFVNNPTNNWAFYHLGFFIFYLQLWLICSSDVPQYITNANEVVSLVSYISLAVLPIHFCAFCTEIFDNSRIHFSVIQILSWIYLFVMIFGFVTNLYDPPEVLIMNHIIILLAMFASTFIAFSRIKNNPQDKNAVIFAVGVVILVLTVGLALGFFYRMPTSGLDAAILGVGILIFSLYLFAIILRIEIGYITTLQKNEVYKSLAYKDIMTDMLNRRAFNEKLDIIDSDNISKKQLLDMMILDINYLKRVNDVQGHAYGDELIIGAANCIKRVFDDFGETYRIGGDEFAIIVIDNHYETMKALERLDKEIESFNEANKDLKLSLSRGLATGSKVDIEEVSLSKYLFRVADEKMYKDKEHWHLVMK